MTATFNPLRSAKGSMWRGYALIAPLFLFLLSTFVVPTGMLLWRSVADPELGAALPLTASVLANWNGRGLPDEAEPALIADLKSVDRAKLASLSRRLSYEDAGFRALLQTTKRQIDSGAAGSLVAIQSKWSENSTWQAMKRAAGPIGAYHLLSAVDLKYDYEKGLGSLRPDGTLYRSIILRTFIIAFSTAIITLVLAFPLCIFLLRQTPKIHNVLLLFVLLPFWTSILVRTTAWLALLQDRGVINSLLMDMGIIDSPLKLLYNRVGVIIAMVHVMLPFMIFPLLGSMRSIDPRLYRAALSLGARPLYAFRRVYIPQVLPGMMAGMLMVFVVSLGFYITPMLVGGPGDQMISYYIALFTTSTLNWGLASSLGLILLSLTLALYTLQNLMVRGGSSKS
ncbi:ABC transporter permease [Rhizobium leguminosarum]|uniref:Polyamine ABC transporter substrate-binding protein n=1 Tax=Rhizobium leguminosarum TaxID=384 RepID=A0A2K9ZCF3_RHILE|nr:ABC transporter permease [Rhizobium leguminosarum]AUW45924.1 Polyamine ABC transporter substrate-binding protein [Rhizobium leguminosarum]